MQNPAEALHRIFERWQQSNPGKAVSLGELTNLEAPDGANDLVEVFYLLRLIKGHIERLERTHGHHLKIYRKGYLQWVQIAAGYSQGWQAPASGLKLVPETSLDTLQTLALYLDGKVFEPPPEMFSSLPDTLRQARDLITSDPDLDRTLARYLLELIRRAEEALEESKMTETFDFETALIQLYTGLESAGLHTSEGNRNRFFEMAKAVLGFVVTTATQAAINAGTTYAMGMIMPSEEG